MPAVVPAHIYCISVANLEGTLQTDILKLYCKTEVHSFGPSGLLFPGIVVCV